MGVRKMGGPGEVAFFLALLVFLGTEEPESLPTSVILVPPFRLLPPPTSGEMSSHNFPATSLNNLHERKTIEVAKGNVINIHFTDFYFSPGDQGDYLQITDGDGTILGHFGALYYVDSSGGRTVSAWGESAQKIPDLTSVTETVHVLFHTDAHVGAAWRLEWSSSPSLEVEQPTSGVLTSPNYPHEYPPGLDYVQKIQVPQGNKIWIRFTNFFCDSSVWVSLDDEFTKLGWFTPRRKRYDQPGMEHVETDWRKRVVSNASSVDVRFHTTGHSHAISSTERGWRLTWGVVADKGVPKMGVLTSPNYPSPYPPNHDSTQTIQVAEGKVVRITFTGFRTERGYDYVQILDEDGTNLMSRSYRGRESGSRVPSVHLSNSNIVHVIFHTNHVDQSDGWRLEWEEL